MERKGGFVRRSTMRSVGGGMDCRNTYAPIPRSSAAATNTANTNDHWFSRLYDARTPDDG